MKTKILALILCAALMVSFVAPLTLSASATETSQPTQPTETTAPSEEPTEAPTQTTQPSTQTAASAQPVVGSAPKSSTEPTVTQTTVPETSVPETTVPETTVPETTGAATDPTQGKEPDKTIQVGDTLWIKSGTPVYKSAQEQDGHAVTLSYKIKITQIVEGGWYKFEFADLSAIVGGIFLKDYCYVQAANTTATQPEETTESTESTETTGAAEDNSCTCDDASLETLAQHPDTCPRKQYILTLIQDEKGEFKTAEAIAADWDSYDEETQCDILDMLEAYAPSICEELAELFNGNDDGFEYVDFSQTTSGGISVLVSAPVGAFAQRTVMTVTETIVQPAAVSSLVSGDILNVVAVDISFGGEQPSKRVGVSIDVPDEKVPDEANMYYVVHMAQSGPELVASNYLNAAGKGQVIPFATDGFSTYAVAFVNNKYPAQLMRDVLANDSRFSIKTVKANLFDYDAAELNKVLINAAGGNKGFIFPAVDNAGEFGGKGINLGGAAAKWNILAKDLTNGLPVFNYLGTDGGVNTGKILFDAGTQADGKTSYPNVDFEFVYDKQTGYYTYNSAWNHAQLNKGENRVELYADTLAIANQYVASVDLTQTESPNQMTISSESPFKATIQTTPSMVDPYVSFPTTSVNTSDVSSIHIRAKIDKCDGGSFTNAFGIYYSMGDGYGEDHNHLVTYTSQSNGQWIDFVIDAEELENWTGTLERIRVDPVSNTSTEVVNATFDFELAWIRFEKKEYGTTDVRNAGYYPFSDIGTSMPGRGGQFNMTDWKAAMNDGGSTIQKGSRALLLSDSTDRQKHLAFGTVIEQQFYIPVSKKTDTGDELKFAFTGDDDLWVFIDGKLVLDIGGGHTPVSGAINFTENRSWVENRIEVTGWNTPTDETGAESKIVNFDPSLFSPGIHTMKIFYLERHSGVSNCNMKFNLPLIPEGTVTVSKEVQDESGNAIEALKDQEYTFSIEAAPQGTGGAFNAANHSFSVVDENGTSTTQTTNEKGYFTLTSSQTAIFDIPENYNVTITEITDDLGQVSGYQWKEVKLNNEAKDSDTVLTTKDKTNAFEFVNVYTPLYGKIKITKSGIEALDHDESTEQQSSVFKIEGTSTTTGETLNLEVVIVGNGSKVIDHVPAGKYTVTEITDWTWRYDATDAAKTATVTGDNTAEVTFQNNRKRPFWLSGDNYRRNYWDSGSADAATN